MLACIAKNYDHSSFKILTSKQIFQSLSIAIAEVASGNTSKNFLIDIHKVTCSLYQAKEIIKKYITT